KERIAVRRRACDRARRDVGSGARTILDHDLIAELLGESLRDHARDGVNATARREADQEGDLPVRIVLRARWRRSAKDSSAKDKRHRKRDQGTPILNGPHGFLPAKR